MRALFFAFSFLILFSSCRFFGGERVRGNGRVTMTQKDVTGFNSVDVGGQFVLRLSQGPASSVKIETDENLVEFIEVYKEGSTLVIHTKDGFDLDPSRELIVHVTAPAYRSIDASGQCEIIGVTPITGSAPLSIEVSGQGTISMQVDVPRLSTDISGQGDVFIKGRATEFFSEVSGSGTIKCLDLITDNTTLDISGSSDVEITANKQLNVDASGASSVHYRGNASVSQNTSGASTVKKVG